MYIFMNIHMYMYMFMYIYIHTLKSLEDCILLWAIDMSRVN